MGIDTGSDTGVGVPMIIIIIIFYMSHVNTTTVIATVELLCSASAKPT